MRPEPGYLSLPPSPLEPLSDAHLERAGVELWVKRDDLLAPAPGDPFCGNKCRKLKYNLAAAREQGYERLLSFGGAYSNHIAALAAAGRRYGFETIGLIRGEAVDNPVLARARHDGMYLHFIDRATYRRKAEPALLARWQEEMGPAYILPEGGSNDAALAGCAEIVGEVEKQLGRPADYLAVACGTGGTLAGLLRAAQRASRLLGVSVLKGHFMRGAVTDLLSDSAVAAEWEVWEDAHHGGYARSSPELERFIAAFERQHGLPLEPIYSGKLFYALYQRLQANYFRPGTRIVAIHTGGVYNRPRGAS